jgi:succinyl-CoA synthetase beta subunit
MHKSIKMGLIVQHKYKQFCVCKLQIVETNPLACCKLLFYRADAHVHQDMKDY